MKAKELLNEEKLASFERQVTDLLKAGWPNLKVANWAASAASGFGVLTREEALELINEILDTLNAEFRVQHREISREIAKEKEALREMFPAFKRYIQ